MVVNTPLQGMSLILRSNSRAAGKFHALLFFVVATRSESAFPTSSQIVMKRTSLNDGLASV